MSFGEYEIRKKPLFASMKRAKEALGKPHVKRCTVDVFFDYLEKCYGTETESIEYITFYDYEDKREHMQYDIAYIYTEPSLYIRDKLFCDRNSITENTGWYPMVSGSRANFTTLQNQEKHIFWDITKHKPPYVHLGNPVSIRNVAKDISSTALFLKCERGGILMDTGFGIEDDIINEINFVIISHFHKDHSGGIYDLLRLREIPVILSEVTLDYLLELENYDLIDKERLLNNTVLIEAIKERSYIKKSVLFFETYHCPGSYGVKYIGYESIFIYTGDMCLANGFYDYTKEFFSYLQDDFRKLYVSIDCALVPRGDFAITEEDVDSVEKYLMQSSNNFVFISKGPEMLFNIYISLFRLAIDNHKNWLFVVNDELYNLLRSTLRSWILRKDDTDPYIKHVLKKSGINYAETQRLFKLSGSKQFEGYIEKRLIVLMTENDLCMFQKVDMNITNMTAYLAGPLAVSSSAVEIAENYKFKEVMRLASPDWSFHTDKQRIIDLLEQLNKQGIRTLLFHAFPKALRKFIKEVPEERKDNIYIVSKTDTIL